MSGLMNFFGAFVANGNVPERNNDGVAAEEEEDDDTPIVDYRLSLQTVSTLTQDTLTQESAISDAPQDDKNHLEPTMGFRQWQKARNYALTDFCFQRFFGNDKAESDDQDSDDDDDQDNDDDVDQAEKEQDENGEESPHADAMSEGPLTQGSQETPVKSPLLQRRPGRSVRWKLVPLCDDATHDATTISSVDLYAKEVSLALCKVDKIFPIREHKRLAVVTNQHGGDKIAFPVVEEYNLLPLPKTLPHLMDDGPLATIFKQVLSMEVTELRDAVSTRTREAAAAVFPETVPKRRIRVFFYNKYAAAVASFLQEDYASLVLISLEHIPSKCVFPHSKQNPRDWFDQDLADHSLCIGDRSSMKVTTQGAIRHKRRLHFDADDVRITLARFAPDAKGETGAAAVEAVFTPKTILLDEPERTSPSRLEKAYAAWKESHSKPDDAPVTTYQQEQGAPTTEQSVEPSLGTPRQLTGLGQSNSPPAKRMKPSVHYHKLSELATIHREYLESPLATRPKYPSVNIYGVVVGFGCPSLTKTNSWMVCVTVVDESLPLPQAADDSDFHVISINFFHPDRDKLPRFSQAGNVLQLYKAGLQEYQGEIQLLGRRQTTHGVAFVSGASSDISFVSSTTPNVNLSEEETKRIEDLWAWGQIRLKTHSTMRDSQRFQLSDVGRDLEDEGHDATVMVAAKLVAPSQEGTPSPFGFLRVWDGTGPPTCDALPIDTIEARQSLQSGDPPSSTVRRIAQIIDKMDSDDSKEGDGIVEKPKSLCGRVVNVAIWEKPHWDLVAERIAVGMFIRFRNVREGHLWNDQKCLMVGAKSWITPLPDTAYEVGRLLKAHGERIRMKEPYNLQSGVLPLSYQRVDIAPSLSSTQRNRIEDEQHPPQGDSTAGDQQYNTIQECIDNEAPGTFRVYFGIVRTVPEFGEDLTLLCKDDKSFQFVVRARDSSGNEIDVIVPDAAGESLLGIKATECKGLEAGYARQKRANVVGESLRWIGNIASVSFKGAKFFVLESVERA